MERNATEPCTIEYEPIGTASRAQLIVVGVDSGDVHDIETIDLSRWRERSGYARRLVEDHVVPWSLPEVERELLRIAVERCGAKPEPAPAWPTLADALDDWQRHETTPTVCTGFQPLDALAGGELPGGLPLGTIAVILGPPGAGKSALALQAVTGALLGDPELTAVWALGEMSREALAARAVSVGSVLIGEGSPVTTSQAKRRRPEARAVAGELRQRIASRLTIVPPTLTPDRIEAAIASTGARIACIDYLQLIRLDGAADARSEVDGVMARLRAMSLEYQCAVLLVSNIGKAVDSSSRIGSLGKNSSQIDFDADLLVLGQPADEPDEDGRMPVKWICKKNRHGQARDLSTLFDGDLQVFVPAEAVDPFPEFVDFAPQGRNIKAADVGDCSEVAGDCNGEPHDIVPERVGLIEYDKCRRCGVKSSSRIRQGARR